MKHFLLPILILCSLSYGVKAQSYLQIGDANETSRFPIYTNWKYAWSSYMIKADELTDIDGKTIEKLALFAPTNMGGYALQIPNQKIYVSQTSEPTIRLGYPDLVLDNYQKVFEGTVNYPTNGSAWVELDITDFDYDGSENLIIHWQNHWGSTNGTPKLFSCTAVDDGLCVASGSDNSFPVTSNGYNESLRPNIRFFYKGDPHLPVNPMFTTITNNATKVSVTPDIKFNLYNSDKYDVYFGTDISELIKVASDIPVAEDGEFTYKPATLLSSKTNYYCRVVAYKGENMVESNILSFTTQKIIDEFPFICDFEEYHIGPISGAKINAIINTGNPESSDWQYENGWVCENADGNSSNIYDGYFTARANISFQSGEISLVTPRIELIENAELNFFWKYNTTQDYQSTFVELTEDGGKTWTLVKALEESVEATEYVYESIDLSAFSGNDVYIRWRYNQTYAYSANYFWLDNIEIAEASNEPKPILSSSGYDFTELAVGGELKFLLNVSNVGNSDLEFKGVAINGPYSCSYVGTIVSGANQDIEVIFKPTESGDFARTLSFDTNYAAGVGIDLNGVAYLPLGEFSESFDVGEMPNYWSSIGSETDAFTASYVSTGVGVPYDGSYAAELYRSSDAVSDVYLVTPGVTNYNTNRLQFYAKKSMNFGGLFEVGVMTNPEDVSSYKFIKSFTLTEAYSLKTVIFPATETAPYIAFKRSDDSVYTKLHVDNISWTPIAAPSTPLAPALVGPSDASDGMNTFMDPVLMWRSIDDIQTGYKISIGTDNPPTNLVFEQDIDAGISEFLLESDLDYDTQYYWQVTPYNAAGDCTNPSVWSFTTITDPTITTLPYTEDFEKVLVEEGVLSLGAGWSIDNRDADNTEWNTLYEAVANTRTHGNKAMLLPGDDANVKNDYLFTPPVSLEAGKTYNIEFVARILKTNVSDSYVSEDVSVYIATSNNYDAIVMPSIVTESVYDDTWKTISSNFSVDATANYIFAFYSNAAAGSNDLVIDDIKLIENGTPTGLVVDRNNKVKLYPNPALDVLSIDLQETEGVSIKIYNQLGTMLKSRMAKSSKESFQISNLPSGWYCVHVQTSDDLIKIPFIKK